MKTEVGVEMFMSEWLNQMCVQCVRTVFIRERCVYALVSYVLASYVLASLKFRGPTLLVIGSSA